MKKDVAELTEQLTNVVHNVKNSKLDDTFIVKSNKYLGSTETKLSLLSESVEQMHEYIDKQTIISNIVDTLDSQYKKSLAEMKRLEMTSHESNERTTDLKKFIEQDTRWGWLMGALLIMGVFLGVNLWKIYTAEKIHTL